MWKIENGILQKDGKGVYAMGLSGYENCYMIDQDGEQLDLNIWNNFVQNCLFHQGVLKDNEEGTELLARHYAQYPNPVSFQTYNEPHYSNHGVFMADNALDPGEKAKQSINNTITDLLNLKE